MPPKPTSPQKLRARAQLLREIVELLTEELSTLSNQQWQDLPELKRKKVVLASRLRQFDWPPGIMDQDPFDLIRLKALITDLEDQSRHKIHLQIELIGNQILALQDLHQYCRECLNVSFQKFYDPLPSA